MSDRPSDQERETSESFSAEVQDYLDQLLTPAPPIAEPEAQRQVGGNVEQPAFAKTPPSLTMVGGTAVSTVSLHSQLRKSMLPRPELKPEFKSEFKPEPLKPFAEPAKPVALKLPLPEVRPAPTSPVRETAPVVADRPATKSVTESTVTAPAVTVPAAVHEGGTAQTPAAPAPVDVDVLVSESKSEENTLKPTEWLANGRPSWAQQRFECLLFTVGGLTLAVPLVELGAIYPLGDELTPIFGQIDWFLGLLPVRNRNIKTVNTAKLVMPERYVDSMKERFAYIITINGVDWGLAVDKVSTAIKLDPDEVRWRGERGKRPWLAGTVVEHMCALLDVSQLAAMFVEQNRPRKR